MVDTLFSSQKQRNIAEGKKAQIVRDMEKEKQLKKAAERVRIAEESMKARTKAENDKISKIQLTMKLEMERRLNDLGREEVQLKKTIERTKLLEIAGCLDVPFFPFA